MSEVLSNTGAKLWSETDYNELWLTVFDQLTGQGGKSNIRLIDEAIGKINDTLDGYKFEFSSVEDRLYISKGDLKLPVSLIDSKGHVASKVDGTTITIDENGIVKGIPVDDALSEESTNPLQNKVIAGELKNIKSKMSTDESTIESNTKRIEANETAISTLNGTGDGSVKKAVSDGIAKVVAGAPEDFDTLKEMSDWISSHESSASAMNTQIQNNKEAISGHVSNADVHFTSEERTKLKGVEVNANKTVVDDKISDTSVNPVQNKVITAKVKEIESNVSSNTEKINSLETEVSNLPEWSKSATKPTYTKEEVGLGNVDNTADADKSVKYATSAGSAANATNATKVNNHTVNADVPSGAKFTDTTYGVATTSSSGLMTTTMVSKLNGIAEGANKTTIDTALSSTSTNPVQNKVVTSNLIDIRKETTVNLIIPDLQTVTKEGITCTNNGDGTYTLNGTATGNVFFNINKNIPINKGTEYKSVCFKDEDYAPNKIISCVRRVDITDEYAFNNGSFVSDSENCWLWVEIVKDVTVSNLVAKPMITTNLNATYDDFVPYTGDTGRLNGDVAELQDSKADKTEVPKLVKVDGKTVFLSEDGVLSAKGGGSSIKPKPVSDVSIVSAKSKVTIKWTDPTDIVVDGAVLFQWQKTVLMYKQGTVPPTSLNDGTIAVEETIRNQYQSTGYGISLADGYDYSFSLFAISTDGTSSDKVSVSAKLYATLTVTTEEASLYGKEVTVTSGSQTVTGTFNDSGSVTLRIPWIGSTVVSSTDGTDTTTTTVNIAEYDKSYNAELSFFKIVTFADGTDEEIAAMIEAHYNNKINIADYWAVGDTRSVSLSAMAATGVGESHRAQTVQLVILGFEHDDLATAINGHSKAAVSVGLKDCLMDGSNASNPVNGGGNTENGYMNSSATNAGGWKNCARRAWCNNVFFAALPSTWQSMVKIVNKKSGTGGGSSSGTEITADKIFLAAEIEIFGSRTNSVDGEGTQYQYYKNATANKYKMPKWSSSGVSHIYWERSPVSGRASSFCYVSGNGSASYDDADSAEGVAPCLCI